jgi:uncharacterized protein (DUF342 family)
MDVTGIVLSEADGQVFLSNVPVVGRPPVDSALLRTMLQEAGFGQCRFFEDAIEAAAADCNASGSAFAVQVAERCNASVQVEIAPDDMAVQVSLVPPLGGKPLALEDLRQVLKDAGVVYGIDEAALMQACSVGQAEHLLVASGSRPEDGHDTRFDPLLKLSASRTPTLDDHGLIDYREHGSVLVVHPGDPLMRRIPPTPGVPGHTVKGRELPPRPGVNKPFTNQLSGAQTATEDPNLLEAASVGQPVLVDCGVNVEPILRVPEVNMNTGNIHFDGTVLVDGEVGHGMTVQASGDIVVKGVVDGGLLEAGGDICVGGGIIAQARVRACGTVSARFAENSSIFAGAVIALDDMALGCELESLNQIIIGEKAPQRGRLVGGSATAMMLVRVPLLGSEKSSLTAVKVGANAELQHQMEELTARLEKEKATEENLKKLIKHLSSAGDPKGMLERVKASWQQAVKIMAQSMATQRELEEKMARTLQARVEVGVAVRGGVDLWFGNKTARLRTEFSGGAFSVDPEAAGIVFSDSAGGVIVVTSPHGAP